MSRVFKVIVGRQSRLLFAFGSIINPLGTNPHYREPQVGDTRLDFAARAGDWRSVGYRMRRSIDRAAAQYAK